MNCDDPKCEIECHHRRKQTGLGWAKCLDCGYGYGYPGIIPESNPVVLTMIEINECV